MYSVYCKYMCSQLGHYYFCITLNTCTVYVYLVFLCILLSWTWLFYHIVVLFFVSIRPVKGICGLTHEVVIGLVANLESRSLHRVENVQRGIQPEHPRSSSTDDVEGFISLLHEMLGPIFVIKQFNSQQPKVLNEFRKQIDGDFGFFYWTGAKTRYNDAELPSFNELSGPGVKERLDQVQVSRRGDPGVFVANRASLPQRGRLTARAQFHCAPVALPPLPLT